MTADTAFIDDCRLSAMQPRKPHGLPMRGSAPAMAAKLNGSQVLRLPCNFRGTTFERASWDRKVNLDLSSYQGVELRIFSSKLTPVSHFAIYFRSGAGWYSGTFFPGCLRSGTRSKSKRRVFEPKANLPAGATSKPSESRHGAAAMRTRSIYLGGIRGYGVLGQRRFGSGPASGFRIRLRKDGSTEFIGKRCRYLSRRWESVTPR